MIEQRQSDFKCLRAFAIGGQPKDRAALCYAATGSDRLMVEPLGSIDELAGGDITTGDAFFVCVDVPSIATLRKRLAVEGNFAPIIGFGIQPRVEEVVASLAVGACSYIEAPFTREKVLDAIESASERSHYLGTTTRIGLAAKFRLKALSPRERQVLEAVADGLSNKLIGRKLEISPRTVEIHRANAFTKLNISHTAEAVRLVLEATYYDDFRRRAKYERPG